MRSAISASRCSSSRSRRRAAPSASSPGKAVAEANVGGRRVPAQPRHRAQRGPADLGLAEHVDQRPASGRPEPAHSSTAPRRQPALLGRPGDAPDAQPHSRTPTKGLAQTRLVFTPTLDALDRDSARASAAQQRVARAAATRAGFAYVGSLIVGLVVLVAARPPAVLDHLAARSSPRSGATLERRTEERVRALVENSSDVITVVAPDLTVRWQSPSVARTLGLAVEDVVGRRLTSLVHPDDTRGLEKQLASVTSSGGVATESPCASGTRTVAGATLKSIAESRLDDPAIEGVVLSMRDISDRKGLEDELRRRAFHDSLTGLANRALFEDRLAHCLARARRHGRRSRSCSSISTTSRRSTTASATRAATSCCRPSPRGSPTLPGSRTPRRDWVATSSRCCSRS